MSETSSSWQNVYWFARMLINTDKYGGIVGKDPELMERIAHILTATLERTDLEEEERVMACKSALDSALQQRVRRATAVHERLTQLYLDLEQMLSRSDDIRVFVLTLEAILIPTYHAMQEIPNDDKQFTQSNAKQILDRLGEQGVARVISEWDDLGIVGCLNVEREIVTREFTRLRQRLISLQERDADVVLAAFVQEFERRLGQKRKTRAGGSLEDVTSYLLHYYGIPATHAPEHFQANIEIDKWIRGYDGWLIGISCKRTLRERWKQVSGASREILSRYKIRELWNIVTYDADLSEDKIVSLGEHRHIFYLPDNSQKYTDASLHQGMKDYVRPLSQFIADLKRHQGNT